MCYNINVRFSHFYLRCLSPHNELEVIMERLLRKGDLVRLERGMEVWAKVPQNSYFSNRQFSTMFSEQAIVIGRVYCQKGKDEAEIVDLVFNQISHIIPVSIEQVGDFVKSLKLDYSPKEFDSSVFEGIYMVDQTRLRGGDSVEQDDPDYYQGRDHLPEGWRVYCHKVDNPEIKVSFYQTGRFHGLIPGIQPINE